MKMSFPLILLILAAGLDFLVSKGFSQTSPAPPVLIEKEARVEASPPPDFRWESADVGRPLKIREIVAAYDDSRATVQITEARQLRVRANSRMRILPATLPDTPLGLELQKGEIYLHSREPGPGMTINTPPGYGKSKGTQFRVRVDENGSATFTVFEGSMELENRHGTLELLANQEGIIEPGRTPRRTARIVTRNIIQWCMYYPGVLHVPELGLTPGDQRDLAASLAAYRAGDLLNALATWPKGYESRSSATRVFRATLLLAVGEVGDSRVALADVPHDFPGRLAIEEMIDAVNFVERPVPHQPRTAGEWLARSYYEQSRSRRDSLPAALAAARKALELAPDFGFAAVRVAELEFSFGRNKAAMEQLSKGLKLAPRNAQAHTLQGFLFSDSNCMAAARASFETAIRLDGALGNAWLGRGLCAIRAGRLEDGRRDLQTAVVLEPNRSLLHSYLGKASAQAGLATKAREDLDYAKSLDDKDPTPWLYSALLLQEQYRPNQAIGELEKSISLNDNRRLYRSSLLLDQDRAVRNANLAKLYQYNGMREVAVREATRAVESDYTNPSAHLFLANSFDALRDPDRILLRYETPWFNELLLSNLLSPVGGGTLSQFVSQQEYSKLLEADGIGGNLTTEWRSTSEVRSTASVFGTHGKVSYGIDAYYRNDDGERPNSEMELQEIYGQLKWQPSPDDIFYFLGKWAAQTSGDNFETYDNQPSSPEFDFEENQEPGLLLAGWNHRWAPGSNTLFLAGRLSVEQSLADPTSRQALVIRDTKAMQPGFQHKAGGSYEFTDPALRGSITSPDGESLVFSPALLRAINPYIGTGDIIGDPFDAQFDFKTRRKIDIHSAEIQHIEQSERNTLLLGGRWQQGRIETDATLNASRPSLFGFATPAAGQHVESDYRRTGLYVYDYWSILPRLTLIGGLAWDVIDHPDNFRNPPVNELQKQDEDLSAKFGFTCEPSRWVTIRGLAASGMGGLTFDESVRLEPSQLAGFNQAYRTVISESLAGSVEAPLYQIYGLSFEGSLPTRTWWGASINAIGQDVTRTRGLFTGYELGSESTSNPVFFPDGTEERLDYDEQSVGLTLNQLLGDEFAIGAGYRVTRSELRSRLPDLQSWEGADRTNEATLQELSLYTNWNSPTGLFARAEANWFCQNLDDDPQGLSAGSVPRDGDEFWQFNALVGYRFWRNQGEVSIGVLNIFDSDYQLSPLNPYGEIVRGRTAVITCRLSF